MPAQARADPMWLFISGVQGVAGTDYQVYGPSSVVGPGNGGVGSMPVDLDGTGLSAEVESDKLCETIPLLPDGQAYTLVATTGGLTGTLTGLPDGAVTPLSRWGFDEGCRPNPTMGLQIHYDTSSPVQTVTATVVDGSPVPVSYTSVAADPYRDLQVNQPSTVTATVTVSSGATAGTVSFSAGRFGGEGRPLDCPDQHVTVAAGSSATATCVARFSMSDTFIYEPAAPTATFTPDDQGAVTASIGRDYVGVDRGTTTTRLEAPRADRLVATVTPTYAGPVSPMGAVEFFADDMPVPKCSAQPLLGGRDGSATATCDPRFLPAGRHKISASYLGDVNFNGSTFDNTLFSIPPAPSPSVSAPDTRPSSLPAGADLVPVAQPPQRHAPQRRCKRRGHAHAARLPHRCRRR